MADIIFIALGAAFFAACIGLTWLFDRIREVK